MEKKTSTLDELWQMESNWEASDNSIGSEEEA